MPNPIPRHAESRADAAVPLAARFVGAVRDLDATEIQQIRDEITDPDAVMFILAAMVPDDRTPAELLTWLHRPDEYRRLRQNGVTSSVAEALLARPTATNQAA
ncbi:hypothetical protein [Saccharopolyspora griseoalba]|uniref:Uncharacterized protein n=1 Tax=Saccharopolyspora griseoalba TaxID=1431848 RepID=A0ABW2LSN0_9PSEU